MTRISFFATLADILAVLTTVESIEPIRYIERNNNIFDGVYLLPRQPASASKIPDLGSETSGQIINSTSWMMTTSDQPFEFLSQPFAGKDFKIVKPRPWMVSFTPGGVFSETAMVRGEITYGSIPDAAAKRLMGRLQRTMKKQFEQRINGNFIGPEAYAKLLGGVRLSTANPAESPLEYDLPRPDRS